MLGPLIVCYLFLGGLGAGACCVLAVLGLLAPRECVTVPREPGRASRRKRVVLCDPHLYRRFFAPGYTAALVALVLGVVCLLADVGRADRLLLLLVSPSFSFLAVGAWALVVCAVLALVFVLAWGGYARGVSFALVQVLQVMLALVALAVMTYAGLLLQSLRAVPLWATPWLPVLFVLSALSCGAALVLATSQFTGAAQTFRSVLRRLALADALVIVLEAVTTAAFVATALSGGSGGEFADTATAHALTASAQTLACSEGSWVFWGGFVLVGLVIPLVLDCAFARIRSPCPPLALTTVACVLVGGFVLRYCVVEAGLHPLIAMVTG